MGGDIADHLARVIEAFFDAIPFSLFAVLDTQHYLDNGSGTLDFETEVAKDEMQADCRTLAVVLSQLCTESESELGQEHLRAMNDWIGGYLREYNIRQKGIDLYKVSYGFGIAFLDYLALMEQQGAYPTRMPFYQDVAGQMVLDVLNAILAKDRRAGLNAQMFFKLRITSLQRRIPELYGKFGTYSIFKNCAQYKLGTLASVHMLRP